MATYELRQRALHGTKHEADLGAGAHIGEVAEPHPAGKVRHGILMQTARAIITMTWIIGTSFSIFLTQMVGAPLYYWRKDLFYAWMALTKQSFALVIIAVTQWFMPSTFRVSWEPSLRGQFKKQADGKLVTTLPERIVLMANHQIYTEWVYFWWTAYTSKMHGHIFIILKESLKRIPILGVGMQFFGFIFLARKWESDKPRFEHRLKQLCTKRNALTAKSSYYDPMWLLIFPEGTNLSANTRKKSVAWSEKSGKKDMRHCLLPRATGMYFCLQQLQGTVDYVYDCTVGYEGVTRTQYAQDFFTLRSTFLQGRPPTYVSLYWRRFELNKIPLESQQTFEAWLEDKWREKDKLQEQIYHTGFFPADADDMDAKQETRPGYLETKVELKSIFEVTQIFVVDITLALMANITVRFLQQFGVLARG